MSKLLRGVVVTNHGSAAERVVLAVEAIPWHDTPQEAEGCTKDVCWTSFHCTFTVRNQMSFDFEQRKVFPVHYYEELGISYTPIPEEDLPKFNADFGIYYSS